MFAYYRLLGVAILSLALSGTMLWVILAWLSTSRSLALTLAGVVGLIVSIGTSLDSNVVYFEHLKEDIGNGRTLRSAVDRSFPIAFKTIFYANLASLIGAGILYFFNCRLRSRVCSYVGSRFYIGSHCHVFLPPAFR